MVGRCGHETGVMEVTCLYVREMKLTIASVQLSSPLCRRLEKIAAHFFLEDGNIMCSVADGKRKSDTHFTLAVMESLFFIFIFCYGVTPSCRHGIVYL